MKPRINKVEHIWCSSDDRWVYIEYDTYLNVIGLNFMQGDEYDLFKRDYGHSDQGLTEFHEQMLETFPQAFSHGRFVNSLSFINKCMWLFHSALALREEYPQVHGGYGKQCCGKV